MYPLTNGMFRIQIIAKKPGGVLPGPLADGAVVHAPVLGALVRATAINASKHLRAQEKFFKVTQRSLRLLPRPPFLTLFLSSFHCPLFLSLLFSLL